MFIGIKHRGSFKKTEKFLNNAKSGKQYDVLDAYGKMGVSALASATPVDSGLTADSWSYQITRSNSGVTITWTNSNRVKGVPVAIILQYGHATGTGGYVKGRDYINPAIQPIFDKIEQDVWNEVRKS